MTKFSDDFVVPYPDENPVLSPEEANSEAFFSTALSPSDTPAEDYDTIKTDLEQTGYSNLLEMKKRISKEERQALDKEAVESLISDSNINIEIRKKIAQKYITEEQVAPTTKEIYINKTASTVLNSQLYASGNQNDIIAELPKRIEENKKEVELSNIEKKVVEILNDTSGTVGRIAAGALNLPAYIVTGLWAALKSGGFTAEAAKAMEDQLNDFNSRINKNNPMSKGTEKQLELAEKLEDAFQIPQKWVGDLVNQPRVEKVTRDPKTGELIYHRGQEFNPGAATVAEGATAFGVALATGTLSLLAKGVAKVAGSALKRDFIALDNKPLIPIDPASPLEVTKVANPDLAKEMAMEVIKGNPKLEKAIGVPKGNLIATNVLPQILPEDIPKADAIDLHNEVIALTEAREVGKEFHEYHPLIIDADARAADTALVMDIINNSKTPYYKQSQSLINITDTEASGNSVFAKKNGDGYAREGDARKALESLDARRKLLPPELQGTLDIVKFDGKHYINWQWKRQYNDIAAKLFQDDINKTTFMGIPVTGLARSGIGKWLFPTGRFEGWVEKGGLLGVWRNGALEKQLIKVTKEKIEPAKHQVELAKLIDEAERRGQDYFSATEIRSMFPELSYAQGTDLYKTHTFWRLQNKINLDILNNIELNKLHYEGMQGLYDKDGSYIGAATTKINSTNMLEVDEVLDFTTKSVIPYKHGVTDIKDKTLIRLREKVESNGRVYHYGLIGGDVQLNLFPNQVISDIPGYSPRKNDSNWYIDILPNSIIVDGREKRNPKGLRDYKRTVAATSLEAEGHIIRGRLLEKYPESDYTIEVRLDREDNYGKVLTDLSIHKENYVHSKKRGERLPSLLGDAPLEDRLTTMNSTIMALSKLKAFQSYNESFRQAFVKKYIDILPNRAFPESVVDIVKGTATSERTKMYDNAIARFRQFERLQNTQTWGDSNYGALTSGIADVLEKVNISSRILRSESKNPLMVGKSISNILFIYLNPQRQYVVQPAQQLEMHLLNPDTAAKSFTSTNAIMQILAADSDVISGMPGIGKDVSSGIREIATKMAEAGGNKNILKDYEAIRNSGLIESVDLNSLVHNVFNSVSKKFEENIGETSLRYTRNTLNAIPLLGKKLGYTPAELFNLTGLWFQTKELWMKKNPGKDPYSKVNQANIAVEALRLSGAMNRGALLPYQEGILSTVMQFLAISQKLTMNVFQNNTTILSPKERAKLAAARFALYGGTYGVLGGKIASELFPTVETEDKDVKNFIELFSQGIPTFTANWAFTTMAAPDSAPTQLNLGKGITPYSEHIHPIIATLWQLTYLTDKDVVTNPRIPMTGALSKVTDAVEDIKGWYKLRELTGEGDFKLMLMEALETTSGMSNAVQGLVLKGAKDKSTKMGRQYGIEYTTAEAIGKIIGIGSYKDEAIYELVQNDKEFTKVKREIASTVYKTMYNARVKLDKTNVVDDYVKEQHRIVSLISMLDSKVFNQKDRLELQEMVEQIDKSQLESIGDSFAKRTVDNVFLPQTEHIKKMYGIGSKLEASSTQVKEAMKVLREFKGKGQ